MINGGRGLSPDGCFYKQINKNGGTHMNGETLISNMLYMYIYIINRVTEESDTKGLKRMRY